MIDSEDERISDAVQASDRSFHLDQKGSVRMWVAVKKYGPFLGVLKEDIDINVDIDTDS